MFYKVFVNRLYIKDVEASSKQEAIDKVANYLADKKSPLVMTYEQILSKRESGQSAQEYIDENNLACFGTHRVYADAKAIEIPFSELGEQAYKTVDELDVEEHEEYRHISVYNMAAHFLYTYQEKAFTFFEAAIEGSPSYFLPFNSDDVYEQLCKFYKEDFVPVKEAKFKPTVDNITSDMISATVPNVYYWAFLHWEDTLEQYEKGLKESMACSNKIGIDFHKYCIVESKKVLVELYNKLITFDEFKQGHLEEPVWMKNFLNKEEN